MMNRRPSFRAPRTLASIALADQQGPGFGGGPETQAPFFAPPETQNPFGKPIGGMETQGPFSKPLVGPETQNPFSKPLVGPETQNPFAMAPNFNSGGFMPPPDFNGGVRAMPDSQDPGWGMPPSAALESQAPGWGAPPAVDPFNMAWSPSTLAGIARRGR